EPPGELVLDDEIGLRLLADDLLHLQVEVLSDLLTDGQLRAAAGFRRQVDLEGVNAERAPNRLCQLARHDTTCQRLGALKQRDLIAFAELIERLVEDNPRQNVRLFERWLAAQRDFRLLEAAADVDARLDPRNDPARPDIEHRIHLVDRLADEA